ncbi:hypothetical protein M1B74_11550 [Bacteroides pyogenes]|uniref:hypothetical protein n=1 Tax=Bacteroides pyogenes TaxID=310300 RepID=UPI003B42EE28
MQKLESKKVFTLFSGLVVLNTFFLLVVLLDVVFPVSRPVQTLTILVLNILFLTLNKGFNIKLIGTSPFVVCFYLFIVLLFSQILISLVTNTASTAILAGSLILILVTFWKLLTFGYDHFSDSEYVIAPYVLIGKYTVIASCIVFVLSLLGVISPYTNPVDPTKYQLFEGNNSIEASNVYHPLYLVFILEKFRGVNFFGQFGTFCGLCHEPHLSTFLVTPSLFLILAGSRNKLMYIILFISSSLLASSVTNIIFIALCLIIYCLIKHKKMKRNSRTLIYVASIFVIIYVALNFQNLVETIGLEIVSSKMQSGNISYDTSTGIIEYMYSPQSFLGTGILIYAFNPHATDIGLVSFILNCAFQISFITGVVKLICCKNMQVRIASIALIYFLMHSFKIGQMMFQFPFLAMMLFIGHMLWLQKDNNDNIIRA